MFYLVSLDAGGDPVFEDEGGTDVSAEVTVEYVTIREKDIIDTNNMTIDDAYDSDDGAGQDAWMLFKPLASGDHFLQIEGSGGFFGSYKVLVYEANTDSPCEVSLTIMPVATPVYESVAAEFWISGSDMPGVPVDLKYTYVGQDYFETSPEVLGTQSMQLTGDGPWRDLDPDHRRRRDRGRRWFGEDRDHQSRGVHARQSVFGHCRSAGRRRRAGRLDPRG